MKWRPIVVVAGKIIERERESWGVFLWVYFLEIRERERLTYYEVYDTFLQLG